MTIFIVLYLAIRVSFDWERVPEPMPFGFGYGEFGYPNLFWFGFTHE